MWIYLGIRSVCEFDDDLTCDNVILHNYRCHAPHLWIMAEELCKTRRQYDAAVY
jgi:hypothetical protein